MAQIITPQPIYVQEEEAKSDGENTQMYQQRDIVGLQRVAAKNCREGWKEKDDDSTRPKRWNKMKHVASMFAMQ